MTDPIIFNGTLCPAQEPGEVLSALLSEGLYLYQHIHTRAHRALHLEAHLDILNTALEAAYGQRFTPPADRLQEEIGRLLAAGRYPKRAGGVMLRVYPGELLPGGDGPVSYLLRSTGPLYYPDYTVWHKRLMLEVMPCEYLLMGYPTSTARQVGHYSRRVARTAGAEAAVIENLDGVLTNVEDEPLFVVVDGRILTSPCAEGATDSVMRRLILRACAAEGVVVEETPLRREMLLRCDEAFTASVQGLVSLAGYRDARYFNLMAGRLAPALNRIEQL